MDDRPAANGDNQGEGGSTRSGESPHRSHDRGAAATRTTGMDNLPVASTVLTATNDEAWEVAQWANATHPATTTVAATRNAPICSPGSHCRHASISRNRRERRR